MFLRRARLEAELAAAHTALAEAKGREAYWRTRYERLADSVLFRSQDISAPVHVEPKEQALTTGQRVLRAATAAGKVAGVKWGNGNLIEPFVKEP